MKGRRTAMQTGRVKQKADMTRKGRWKNDEGRAGGVPAVITRPFP